MRQNMNQSTCYSLEQISPTGQKHMHDKMENFAKIVNS